MGFASPREALWVRPEGHPRISAGTGGLRSKRGSGGLPRCSGAARRPPKLRSQPPAPSQNWCHSLPEAGSGRNSSFCSFLESKQPFGSCTKPPRQSSRLRDLKRKGTQGEFVPPVKAPVSSRNKSLPFTLSPSLRFFLSRLTLESHQVKKKENKSISSATPLR